MTWRPVYSPVDHSPSLAIAEANQQIAYILTELYEQQQEDE